ncbi:MAG: transketolase [Saprospiraceae bacterium]|nr:transketolase [Candidatus Vicinibacter proximus]MBL7823432.1 transketolase [Saprospiraceae bacterium]MCC6842463.1 transketolase [Saprospiraceae bacterium]HRG32226.1 thiamine pyrophosphate-dependent enzyme [Saprospiraceae bacterium]
MSIYSIIQNLLDQIEGPEAEYKREVIKDLWVCLVSREVSLLGRKEVLTGKAKFGILGDGKELPQVAMARAFKKGDFRSGYYRDQTFMFALGLCSVKEYFGQLYADPQNDPFSGGRQMNAHFATPLIDQEGNWTDHTKTYNVSSDVSSTGGQMARALGLALASKHYRQNKELKSYRKSFSNKGNEVSFVTIGDASTSEGVFWETMNAASVLQVPLAVCVWDDGYGISVPIALQTVKQNISEALSGFEKNKDGNGLKIFTAKAWDYPSLVKLFHEGVEEVRREHVPGLFHIKEVTQPQGHSTSGSHERYKSKKRLDWEEKFDCIKMFSEWITEKGIASKELCDELKELSKIHVRDQKNEAWSDFLTSGQSRKRELLNILESKADIPFVDQAVKVIHATKDISWHELVQIARNCIGKSRKHGLSSGLTLLDEWISNQFQQAQVDYHAHLYSETAFSALKVKETPPQFSEGTKEMNGYQIINQYFDQLLAKYPEVVAFGEDVGMIGDVNQGFAGLQEKYGDLRVFDTGIREWTIIGQAIGMSMRGLRPISEIQYLDYIVYALSPLMDDLATLRYRSDGIQRAPTIIRTRGHRLEGIWHSGSPIGMLLNSLRGVHVCVPRNMTQAAGMYQTLLQSDDPGLVIECLNGYRLKEKMPDNLGEYTIPLGRVEVLRQGNDVTLVTYGSCVRIAEKAIEQLSEFGIEVELIDVQTLLPFDLDRGILKSLRKTNKLVILDEDVPGGASAYILQQVLEEQNAFRLLDCNPVSITASAHRPPYGSDGDYFSKPNAEDVTERIYQLMHEYEPSKYI